MANAKNNNRTSQNKEALLKCLELSLGNIREACEKCKIDRGRYYEWMQKDPDFKEAVKYINEATIDFVEGKMLERIKGYTHRETKVFQYKGGIVTKTVDKHYPPDSSLIAFYLETKGQSRGYIKKMITEEHKRDPYEDMTEEELDAAIAAADEEDRKEKEAEKEFRTIKEDEGKKDA